MLTITYFVFASVLEPFWGEMNILTSESLRWSGGLGKIDADQDDDGNHRDGLEGGHQPLLCVDDKQVRCLQQLHHPVKKLKH